MFYNFHPLKSPLCSPRQMVSKLSRCWTVCMFLMFYTQHCHFFHSVLYTLYPNYFSGVTKWSHRAPSSLFASVLACKFVSLILFKLLLVQRFVKGSLLYITCQLLLFICLQSLNQKPLSGCVQQNYLYM